MSPKLHHGSRSNRMAGSHIGGTAIKFLVCVMMVSTAILLAPAATAGGNNGDPGGTYSIEPLDLQVRAWDSSEYRGVGISGSLEPEEDDGATQEWDCGRNGSCRFVVKVKNPESQNPNVPASAYTLYAERLSNKAALYRFNRSAPDGPDITDQLMSDSGFRLDEPFRPGEEMYIYVTVVPVGRANETRGIRMYWRSEKPSLSSFIPIAVPSARLPSADSIPEGGYDDNAHIFNLYKNPSKGKGKDKDDSSSSSKGLINVGSYSAGTPEVVEAIENGFQSAIVGTSGDSISMPVNPGYRKKPVSRAVASRVGDTVFVPVQGKISGNGRNATYEVTGVAECKITHNDFAKKIKASLTNYWDDLDADNLPKEGGGQMYDAIDISVTVSGSKLQMGDWKELH